MKLFNTFLIASLTAFIASSAFAYSCTYGSNGNKEYSMQLYNKSDDVLYYVSASETTTCNDTSAQDNLKTLRKGKKAQLSCFNDLGQLGAIYALICQKNVDADTQAVTYTTVCNKRCETTGYKLKLNGKAPAAS